MSSSASGMPPIPNEYRQLVINRAPGFVRAVSAARKRGEAATADLRSFRDDPFLLYAALWHASSEEVAVIVTP